MGTCSTLIHKSVLEKLKLRDDCKILNISDFGEDLFQVQLEHESFSGYVGQYCTILEDNSLHFRRDLDV